MKGFTLIEILLALAILMLLLGITVPVGWNFFTSSAVQSERDTLISLITRARTYAITNKNSAPHGIAISAPSFTLFQGASYAARAAQFDEPFPRTNSVTITGPSELVVTPLSGDTTPGTFTLSLGTTSRTVSINSEGMMEY